MWIFLFSFLLFAAAMAGLAVGMLAGRGPLRGSCGGLNLADGTRIDCGYCKRTGRPRPGCPRGDSQ
ncbi:MAG: hypothetical protein KJO54_04000 [Gammaproteobacteria bacterium]|nr:hypothetical protein [Gammaproteobacteria bacterium]